MAFQISLSTRTARSQVRQLDAQLIKLGQSADKVGARMQSSVGGAGGVRALRNIEAAINSVNMNLTKMGATWMKAQTQGAVAAGNLNKRITTQATRFKTATVASDQYGNSLLTVSQKAAILRSGMLALGTHVGIFSAATLLAATITFGLVKAIKAVVTIGSEFTRSLAHTSAIMGETRANLSGLTEQMFRLAETTKFTTTEVAEASTVLAKTGLKAAAVAKALPAVLDLAAIGSMDMARAADIAANAMFGFQLKARDLTMVVDTLAFAATNSNTTVQQLGNALSFAAPVAAATGAKFKDVAGLLAVMADSGVKASRAGTTLRRAFVNLINPSDEAATVLRDLNVEIRDGEGQMRSMVDIMRDFAEAGGNVQDLEAIFGVRALPGMAAIWQDLAKEVAGADSKMKDFFERMETEGKGSSNRMREAMEKNLIDTWLKFTSVLSVEATRAFALVEKSMTDFVISMTDFVREGQDMEATIDKIGLQLDRWGVKLEKLRVFLNIKPIRDFNSEVSRLGPSVSEIMFPEGMFSDFSTNLDSATQAIRQWGENLVLVMLIVFKKLPIQFKKIWAGLGGALNIISANMAIRFKENFRPVFNWFADKFNLIADGLNFIKAKGFSSILRGIAEGVSSFGDNSEAKKALKEQVNALEKVIVGYDLELLKMDQIGAAFDLIHAKKMDAIADERMAELGQVEASLAHIEKMQRIRDRLSRDVKKGSRDPFEAPDVDVSKGRGILMEDSEGIMSGSIKDMKEFIKLQNASIASTKTQIETLLTLKLVSPFEAFRGNIGKAEQEIVKLQAAYTPLIAELERFKEQANDTGHTTKAKEYQEQIDKVTVAFDIQNTVLERFIANQSNGLTELQNKYELVADGVHGYIVRLTQLQELSETELITAVDKLREEGKSEMEQIQDTLNQKMDILNQARETELTLQAGQHERMLLAETEFQSMMLQLQIQAGKERNEELGGGLQDTFDLAEAVRAKDLAGAMSSSIKMLDQAGKTSKKAFEASKKVKIAQAIMATYSGAAEAMTWGFPMGPIFAALMIAQGLQQVQAIRSTSFGGGGGGGGGGGVSTVSASAPPPIQIAPQTDSIFNQTNTGGVPNTIDTSNRGDLSVEFTINAVDADGIQELLFNQQSQIVGMVQEAYNDRGASGGPVQ